MYKNKVFLKSLSLWWSIAWRAKLVYFFYAIPILFIGMFLTYFMGAEGGLYKTIIIGGGLASLIGFIFISGYIVYVGSYAQGLTKLTSITWWQTVRLGMMEVWMFHIWKRLFDLWIFGLGSNSSLKNSLVEHLSILRLYPNFYSSWHLSWDMLWFNFLATILLDYWLYAKVLPKQFKKYRKEARLA